MKVRALLVLLLIGSAYLTESLFAIEPAFKKIVVSEKFHSEGAAFADFNVRHFGALGDGKTKDTVALQKAIDACTSSGGGTVVVPPGTYVTGSLFLKNNVDFYLMRGAMLLGSPDKEDYNKADVCPQNSTYAPESSFGAHLILCIEQKNVTVRGPGRIDGNSIKFIVNEKGEPYPGQSRIPWRPSQMLYFVESDNIRLQDIELTNSPYWTSFFHGCTHVFIRGVQVRNLRTPYTFNGDGIDIDCCEYVSLSDCQIDVADDGITLRGSSSRLKKPRPCRYVTIDNCVISAACNCMRFGVGDGQVNNIVVNNIVVETSRTAFNFVSSWSTKSRGVDIDNIRISNVVVDCQNLIRMYYKYAKTTEFRNISFRGISGVLRPTGTRENSRRNNKETVDTLRRTPLPERKILEIQGNQDFPIRDIFLSDVNLDVYSGARCEVTNVEGLSLENVVLRSVDPSKPVNCIFKNVTKLNQAGRIEPVIPSMNHPVN